MGHRTTPNEMTIVILLSCLFFEINKGEIWQKFDQDMNLIYAFLLRASFNEIYNFLQSIPS